MFQIRLKELREREKLSQQALANILGVSQSTVGMWESGKNKPEHETLIHIAEYFQTSLDYLVGKEIESAEKMVSEQIRGLVPVPVYPHAGDALKRKNTPDVFPFAGLTDPQEYFCLRTEDDSMENAGIRCGSLVLVHRQHTVANGRIAACLIDGRESLLRRISRQGKTVLLLAENSGFSPLILEEEQPAHSLQIVGEAVRCITGREL